MRTSEARLERAGAARFLSVPASYEYVAMGWPAFAVMERVCRRLGVTPERLEHRYTEENYGGIVAVFEVHRVEP